MSFSRNSSTTSHGNSWERVDLGGARRDPLARELPDEVAQLPLLVVQDVPGHGGEFIPERATCLGGRPLRSVSRGDAELREEILRALRVQPEVDVRRRAR